MIEQTIRESAKERVMVKKNNQGMTFQLFEFDLMELMMSVCDCVNKLNLRGESR